MTHMFDHHITKNLREREEVVEIIRRAPIVESGRILLTVLLILGPFFFLFPLFRLGGWGITSFFVSVGVGVLLAGRTLYVWSVNVFVLTNERIVDIDQRGFFSRVVSSSSYDKIQDVSFSVRGLWQTMLQVGSIEIQTAGSDVRLELSGVKDPQRVQERLAEVMRQYAPPSGNATAERLLAALDQIERAKSPRAKPRR